MLSRKALVSPLRSQRTAWSSLLPIHIEIASTVSKKAIFFFVCRKEIIMYIEQLLLTMEVLYAEIYIYIKKY